MRLRSTISHTSLPSELGVSRLEIDEGLSKLFVADIECVSADPDWELMPLLGTSASVTVEADDGSSRHLHGVVEAAGFVGNRGDLFAYRLRLMPRLRGLAHRVRTRIFQDKSLEAVIREVFSGAGIPAEATKWSVAEGPVREYCAQWKESELTFVLRLLEDAGIFFWFDHSAEDHVMYLADSPAAHVPIEGAAGLSFRTWEGRDALRDIVTRLTYSARLVPDAVMLRDWNWQTPMTLPEAKLSASGGGGLELYEFPAGFVSAAAGKRLAADRLSAARVRQRVLRGTTPSLRLSPGRLFQVVDAEPAPLNGEYLLLETRQVYEDPTAGTLADGDGRYRSEFTAIPSAVEFRPPRVTPRPRVMGKELGVVTGPVGEEIHVDKFGRVKVHFYWDREGAVDDTSSCWMRVQQQNTAGSQILPRVGWEVEVGFLHGDPDRPLVLQKVYNAETLPPYALPDNLMQSSLQSSTTPGGGGTNEVRLNDGMGGMEFFVHSQKDLSLQAGHNLTEQIAVDEAVQIASDSTSSIGATEDVSVGGDQSASITGMMVEDTAGKKKVVVGAVDQWGVGAMHAITVKGARTENVGGLRNVLAQKVTETFNADLSTSVGGVLSINAVRAITEAVAGKKTELVAGAKLELIKESKAENIGAAKVMTAGLVNIKTGKDLTLASGAAMAITTGGPMVIKCGKDFNLSGSSVTITVAKASVTAGAKLEATPASVQLKGDTVGGDGTEVQLKGTIEYK
ncbi:type VI secretion system tip protein VgrG [Myxococcus sp. K15C18031901]|uniref:type VI secretion system Vgr family protein n=1 Tax=Myxococcus dinghuensis TaxID=2906761 RepID=UPI0020A7C959|nr:type VI secretion system tip protein TssI/VgrG [Myxococcus dinghuensis]MCP3098215.1 type VI secretion system tip protein VgrG [Myxococcus dinghuensis]